MALLSELFSVSSLILFITAIIANGLSAMAGGGSGLLQLPILLFMEPRFGIALATHKIASVALGLGSSLRYHKERLLDWRFCLIVLAFALPGVIVGAAVILQVSDTVATLSLGLLTLSLGIYSICKPKMGQYYRPKNRRGTGLILGGMGLFIVGFANGSFTSGSGLLATFWFIYWFGMDYKRGVAMTMVLVGLFWNGTGAFTLALLSEVKWSWLPPLIAGSIIGGYLGANIALDRGNTWIKRLFEALTMATGISLIIKVL